MLQSDILLNTIFYDTEKLCFTHCLQGGWRFEGPCYPTIPELVRHQWQSGEPVTNKSQTILANPIVRESWELNNDDVVLETKIGNVRF